MAMIKGFQLKAVKSFRGHEGEPLLQGNLYFGNKKAGFVSEDAHGGYPTLDIAKEYREEWKKATEAYAGESKEKVILTPEEEMFYALLELSQNEKTFKSALKKGYSVTAQFTELVKCPDGTMIPSGKQLLISTFSLAQVEDYEKSDWEKTGKAYKKEVFSSLEDFVIA